MKTQQRQIGIVRDPKINHKKLKRFPKRDQLIFSLAHGTALTNDERSGYGNKLLPAKDHSHREITDILIPNDSDIEDDSPEYKKLMEKVKQSLKKTERICLKENIKKVFENLEIEDILIETNGEEDKEFEREFKEVKGKEE